MRRAVGAILASLIPCTGLASQEPGERLALPLPGTEQQLDFVWVPGGTFAMGSPAGSTDRDADEGPAHDVRIPGFWMATVEVTQDQYTPFRFRTFDGEMGASPELSFDADAVTRPSPPYEDPGHGLGTGDHPAAGMTRYNALHYARWVWEKTGRFVRLPTEAEWEYACRTGGTASAASGLAERAWMEANSRGTHHPVGAKAPNAWGLYDMQGNVAEWVLDGYDADVYAERAGGPPADAPWAGDPIRGRGVVRGGAFDDPPQRLRCAERFPEDGAWKRRDPQIPKSRWWNTDSPHVGFRLVLPATELGLDEARSWFDEMLGGPSGGDRPSFDPLDDE